MNAEILGLRTWRLRRKVTLDSIASTTKLSISQLEAIECGDFRKLPGGIYTTNYIRQYARAIEFDETEILDYYRKTYAGPAPDPSETKRPGTRVTRLLFEH